MNRFTDKKLLYSIQFLSYQNINELYKHNERETCFEIITDTDKFDTLTNSYIFFLLFFFLKRMLVRK